ncbi:hypothetical protein M9Y10_007057 [Tritrichomonas musculus]|uniref:Uncharacterized protein n=1 Tax=Tritrichomonas musculus TaxID=1915356 RepID=A0ABR2J157_9EUKA
MDCNNEDLSSAAAYQCGLVCNTSDGSLEYTFKGIQFAIYGTNSLQFCKFQVSINDTAEQVINEYGVVSKEYALLYTSRELDYGEHKIKTSPVEGTYEIYKFVYWPSKNARRINISEFSGSWVYETDGIGGVRQNKAGGGPAREISNIGCTNIWVYGTLGNWLGKSTLSFGDFSHDINELQSDRKDNTLIYETPEFSYASGTIKFSSPTGSFVINCVFATDPMFVNDIILDDSNYTEYDDRRTRVEYQCPRRQVQFHEVPQR